MNEQPTTQSRLISFVNSQSFSWLTAAGLGVALGAAVVLKPLLQPLPSVQTSAPAVDARWDRMVTNIKDLSSGFDGEVGIYIKDLKTGRTYEQNENHQFITASLIKVPVMASLMREVESGHIRLDQTIRYDRRYRREGSGSLKWSRTGTRFTVSQLLWHMITESDNTATAMIVSLVGYDKLNAYFAAFGLQETRITQNGLSLVSHLKDPSTDNYTTPAEMGMLLEKIYRHQIVHNDQLGNLMLDVMEHANAPSRLHKFLPRQWLFARKTGLLRKNCHDMGIVYGPDSDYVICVMTGESRSYASAKGFISHVGKEAFDYIGRAS